MCCIDGQLITFTNSTPFNLQACPPIECAQLPVITLVGQSELPYCEPNMTDSEYERLEYRQALEIASVRHSSLYTPSPVPCRYSVVTNAECQHGTNNMIVVPCDLNRASGILRFARPEHISSTQEPTGNGGARARGPSSSPYGGHETHSEDGIVYDNFAREKVLSTFNALNDQQTFGQMGSHVYGILEQTENDYSTLAELNQNGLSADFCEAQQNESMQMKREIPSDAGAGNEASSRNALMLGHSESNTSSPEELMQTAGHAASLRRKQLQFEEAHV